MASVVHLHWNLIHLDKVPTTRAFSISQQLFSSQSYCISSYSSSVLSLFCPPHVCASQSWGSPRRACHPIRTKSDFTKRLHHLGGLLGSRHWDALQLGDCLHSFSQQLTHSASALKQISHCLTFEVAAGRHRQTKSEHHLPKAATLYLIIITASNDNVRTM